MKTHSLWTGCLITALVVLFFLGADRSLPRRSWAKDSLLDLPGAGGGGGDQGRAHRWPDHHQATGPLPGRRQHQGHRTAHRLPGGRGGALPRRSCGRLRRSKLKKKIVASLGTVAASGGYYIACGADLIMANRGTATGSIGVIMQFTNVEELDQKGRPRLLHPEIRALQGRGLALSGP